MAANNDNQRGRDGVIKETYADQPLTCDDCGTTIPGGCKYFHQLTTTEDTLTPVNDADIIETGAWCLRCGRKRRIINQL